MPQKKGSDLFIVDNSDKEWKVFKYLNDWCEISSKFDIASAFFEIGALLSLDGQWQKLENIRILMGDEVSKRTQQVFEKGLFEIKNKLDLSIENEKIQNAFLNGVPAIIDALKSGKIKCRVYRKQKFHAKTYITHSKIDVVGSAALIGSSNFTYPGLHDNIELNIQIRREVDVLQEWFENYWNEAEEVTPEILNVIERHTKEYSPFEIYLKALYEYYKGHEITDTEWEKEESTMYKILDTYQIEGYRNLLKISNLYKGAFLCDSVGLGKTFIGLMLIERLLFYEKKRVVLIVPKSAREPVWETKIKKYIPGVLNGFLPFKIINHSDLLREKSSDNDWPEIIKNLQEQADVIIIDEAHNFRNRSSERYRKLYETVGGNKQLFLLTATPINNSLLDLQHQIELFTQRDESFFSNTVLGIHSLRGHFLKMERDLSSTLHLKDNDTLINEVEAEKVLRQDNLFNSIVVQRSRAYVVKSSKLSGGNQVIFPRRNDPAVIPYSLKKVYGKLIEHFKKAFSKEKPLLNLPIYYPYAYYIGEDKNIDPLKEGRQKQVVTLIKILLLKRFESSIKSFHDSCEDLLLRLFAFVKKHEPKQAKIWEARHSDLIEYIKKNHPTPPELFESEDSIPQELLETFEELNPKDFDITQILLETLQDLEQLAIFINDLREFNSSHDDKLNNLIDLLKNNEKVAGNKLLIFTEFKSTAVYLYEELKKNGFKNLYQIDGDTKLRNEIIVRFSPYYNDSSPDILKAKGESEIQILISTDVLSEGINLQDATCMINYDIHWNPVRLMQRIGRIDRRLDSKIEEKIIKDRPELEKNRGNVFYWNCIPPKEINEILSLYNRVTSKALKISKTFGIEGKKLLTPDDDYEALKEFNSNYEGTTSNDEQMLLEFKKLKSENPELHEKLRNLPLRIFSGKEINLKGVFFCYRLPAPDMITKDWSEDNGYTKWYVYNLLTEKLIDDTNEIYELIKSLPEDERSVKINKDKLNEIIKAVEKHINNTYFKQTQAPIGVKAVLKCWLELN